MLTHRTTGYNHGEQKSILGHVKPEVEWATIAEDNFSRVGVHCSQLSAYELPFCLNKKNSIGQSGINNPVTFWYLVWKLTEAFELQLHDCIHSAAATWLADYIFVCKRRCVGETCPSGL